MKVAIVQFAVNDEESKEQKIIRMEGILDNLKGTDLIVLPELWNIGFFAYEEYASRYLLTGPTFSSLARAKGRDLYLYRKHFWWDGDKCYNTAGLIDREGRLLGTYRKMHLFQRPNASIWNAVTSHWLLILNLANRYDYLF
ncbi:MAG: nitrilase-related carbon-nitrogen hydrolase [Acutalibacteraceae bacterium]